jgi:hypothetical protein
MFATTELSWDASARSIRNTASVSSINQRGSFNYEFTLEGNYDTGESGLETPSSARTKVTLILMTQTIYEESPFLKVQTWLRGSPFGGIASSAIELVISRSGLSSQTISCGSTSNTAGMVCSGSLASRWFDGSSINPQVHAQIVNTDSTSSFIDVTVVPQLVYQLPSNTHMWLVLPSFTLLPGSEFSATLYANTSINSEVYALGAWAVEVVISEELTFQSVASSMFDVSGSSNGNTLVMAATFKSSFADDTESLTGEEVELATISFSLSGLLETTILDDAVFSVFIDDMVSVSNSKKVDDAVGSVLSFAGFGLEGVLSVETEFVAGLQTYVTTSSEQELVNTAVLNGVYITSTITKKEIMSCHTTGSESCSESSSSQTVNSGMSCTTTDSNSLSVTSSCDVVLTGIETHGSNEVVVATSYEGFTDSVIFRVWFPIDVSLEVGDNELGKVASACTSDVYQETQVTILGKWDCGDAVTAEVDLTSVTALEISSADVVKLDGNVLSGLTVGSSEVSMRDGTSVGVSVIDKVESPVALHAIVLNEVEVVTSFSQEEFTFTEVSSISAVARQSLTAEGDSATVFAYVEFADAHVMYVGDSIVLSNIDNRSLTVVPEDTTRIAVVTDAVSNNGTDLLDVSWVLCGEEVITGQPWINVVLPEAVDVQILSNVDIFVPIGDPLAQSPVNYDTEAVLRVTLFFC